MEAVKFGSFDYGCMSKRSYVREREKLTQTKVESGSVEDEIVIGLKLKVIIIFWHEKLCAD